MARRNIRVESKAWHCFSLVLPLCLICSNVISHQGPSLDSLGTSLEQRKFFIPRSAILWESIGRHSFHVSITMAIMVNEYYLIVCTSWQIILPQNSTTDHESRSTFTEAENQTLRVSMISKESKKARQPKVSPRILLSS